MPSSNRTRANRPSIRARRISSPPIRQRPSASRTRRSTPASSPPPARASATRRPISPASTAWSTARTRAKASCAAAASCIPSSASPSWRRTALSLDNTAQAVLGVKEGGGQALAPRRRARAGGADARRLSQLRLDREHRPQERRGAHHQRLPGGDRDRQGRPMGVPALRRAVRQRRLSLHLRHQAHERRRSTARFRECGGTLPPHDAGGERRRQSRCTCGS